MNLELRSGLRSDGVAAFDGGRCVGRERGGDAAALSHGDDPIPGYSHAAIASDAHQLTDVLSSSQHANCCAYVRLALGLAANVRTFATKTATRGFWAQYDDRRP